MKLTSLVVCLGLLAWPATGSGLFGPLPVSVKGKPLTVSIHERGKPIRKGELAADCAAAVAVEGLLKARRGWWPSFASYAPGTTLGTKDGDFDVNLGGDRVVVNDNLKGRPRQVVRSFPKDEVDAAMRAVSDALREQSSAVHRRFEDGEGTH